MEVFGFSSKKNEDRIGGNSKTADEEINPSGPLNSSILHWKERCVLPGPSTQASRNQERMIDNFAEKTQLYADTEYARDLYETLKKVFNPMCIADS